MSQTVEKIIYSPTFLQKLLGRNYKWWYLLHYQIKRNITYRVSTLIWMFGRIVVLFTTVFIWWLNIEAGSNLYNFKEIFTYYIFGSLISIGNGVHWNLSVHIKKGSLSSLLLSPTPLMPRVILEDFGWWLFPTLVETTLLGITAFFGWKFVIFSSPNSFLLYILCGIIGYFISTFFAYFLGSLALFFIDIAGFLDLQKQADYFLSGKAVPLNVTIILQPLAFLPFAFTFYHPMQIYLGEYDFYETIWVLAGGIFWCIFLYFLAKLVFQAGLKKNESVGL